MKAAVVIPSMRGSKALESLIEIAPDNVDFVVIAQEKLPKKYERTTEFNDKDIFPLSWIFNRYSKRNYGFAYAYKQNYDIILSIDDDCFPMSSNFFEDHFTALKETSTDAFNILKLYSGIPREILEKGPRGFPTKPLRKVETVINQGLWAGDLDLPALTIGELLHSTNGKVPSPLSSDPQILNQWTIPQAQLVTVCGMNMSFLREVTPAFPYTYMEAEGYGIARYDDIWSGLFIKHIIDRLGKRMSAGFPIIKHDKGAREISKDIQYEEKGDFMNNYLWNNLPNLQLEGSDYVTCFLEIAQWLAKISQEKELRFFKKISDSMFEWTRLIDKGI